MSEETADLVVIMITGPENKRRLPSAFFLAATAAAAEQNVIMYFTGPATELLKTGVAENLYPMEGGKSIADFMKNAMDNGVKETLINVHTRARVAFACEQGAATAVQ